MSMAFSEARFSMLPRSPACPAPNAAFSSMSDRRPALCDLKQADEKQLCFHKSVHFQSILVFCLLYVHPYPSTLKRLNTTLTFFHLDQEKKITSTAVLQMIINFELELIS